MSFIDYIKRTGKYILKGIPDRKVFVSIDNVSVGDTLRGKKIVITGGGSGIGKAITLKCASEGADVLIVGRNDQKLKLVVEQFDNISFFVCDVTNSHDIEDLKKHIISIYGSGFDVLVNNAGIYKNIKIADTNEDDYDAIFNTDMRATYFVTQKLLALMNRGGEVLNIVSDTAFINSTNPYHLAKTAMDAFTRGLAKELLDREIRVNAIAPGPTLSEINTTDPKKGLQRTDKYRVLLAEEIANIAWFLISDMAIAINGQTICCDEGDSLR